MKVNILFVLLIFCAIIIIAQNGNTIPAMIFVATIVNLLLFLSSDPNSISMLIRPSNLMEPKSGKQYADVGNKINSNDVLVKSLRQPAGLSTAVDGVNSVDIYKNRILDPYGKYYITHQAYNDLLQKPAQLPLAQSCSERTRETDSECALSGIRRTRDQRAMDGACSKTADYYAYNYAEEFDEAESKVWWGGYDV